MDQIFIQHRFTVEKDGQSYSDAIVLPQEEYEKLTPEDIENTKNERFTNWQEAVKTPAPQVELKDIPTEELQAQSESIDKQILDLQAQKTQVLQAITLSKPRPKEVTEKPIYSVKEL